MTYRDRPQTPRAAAAESARRATASAGWEASLRRALPLIALAAGFVAFFAFGLDRYFTFEALREHRLELVDWVAANNARAALVYVAVYVAVIAVSVPAGTAMTLAGGFLFGIFPGILYVAASATLGATIVFLAARTALGEVMRARAGPRLRKIEDRVQANAWSYMFVLRLVPLFPFSLVNLGTATLGFSLRVFITATFIGILPGTLVYISLGSGLGSVIESGGRPDMTAVFSPEILAPLVGLALLALLPVIYKAYRARRAIAAAAGRAAEDARP